MINKVEVEEISEKISSLDKELDTFIEAVKKIEGIREAVGTLPEDLERNKAEIEDSKKELERLTSSANDLLADFEKQAMDVIADLKKKAEGVAEKASATKGPDRNNVNKFLESHKKVMEKRIKIIEEKFYKTLTRQKYAIVLMSALFISGMMFLVYLFFLQNLI